MCLLLSQGAGLLEKGPQRVASGLGQLCPARHKLNVGQGDAVGPKATIRASDKGGLGRVLAVALVPVDKLCN